MTTPNRPPNEAGAPRPEDSGLLYGDLQDRLIAGHSYDGIKEYDNPMPGWWVWIFVLTIGFAVVYVVGLHGLGWINSYEADLAAGQAALAEVRAAHAAANPSIEISEAALQALVEDAAAVTAGAATYAAFCAACHGAQGEGSIGPAFTDGEWLHGGSNEAIFASITDGIPARGMPGWENAISPEGRAQLVAFIRSLGS